MRFDDPLLMPYLREIRTRPGLSTLYARSLGLTIRTSELLTERVQHSRSPARARRRARRGFPQHMVDRPQPRAFVMGNEIVMHPSLLPQLEAVLSHLSLPRLP
jgi:hypothetical protein